MILKPAILLSGCLAGAALAAPGDSDWAVKGAPWRVSLAADSPPDTPSAGWQIRLPDFGAGRPDMRDVILLGADGKEIGLLGIWRGQGRALLMLAESMQTEGTAKLYFGGNASRRMSSWTVTPSLLMETRRMPEGAKIATYAGWQEAWRKATVVDGAAFVPQIFHGGNPFGAESRYLTRYTGQIKTGDGGNRKFYTLSDDVSYVLIDGRSVLQWTQDKAPPREPEKVPLADVRLPKEFAKVDYSHAAVEAPGAMVLGWEQGGKLGSVPPEAWVHPGRVKTGAFESADGTPVPLGELEAESYLGYAGEWYVQIKASIPDPGEGWLVEWLWPDGRVDQGPEIRRLWMSLDPVRVGIRLTQGKSRVEGWRLLVIPREMKAASVNNPKELLEFLDLLDKENPSSLPGPAQKAGWTLAEEFQTPSKAARWAEAWVATTPPAEGAWAVAMTRVLRQIARTEPKAALDRLARLSAEARKAMGSGADLLELDLRVFGLNDPTAVGLVQKLKGSNDKALARIAAIRLGDYHLLNGRIEDAARCFAETDSNHPEEDRKAPVIDRSRSLAIEHLVNGQHIREARGKLNEWERLRPMAKLDSDQLLWRARVLMLEENWKRALQDLETSLKIRPGAPEEIELLFWQGRVLYELGRKDEARTIWTALRKDYPKHERAETAKLWMEKP